jgi:3-hydroxyisobutyrate dehydrogenase-like beta-hydroxyacid dehydrogenase
MSTVAVVGLGAMGSRIAGRLLSQGREVVVWNRTSERAVALAEQGAAMVASPAEAAARAEVVVMMVSDAVALRAVTEGPSGLIAKAGSSPAIIQMSTVGSSALSRLASMLPKDGELLDAPVLGSISEAEAGSLAIFVGGERSHFERWRPLLSVLGSPLHVGPLGAGTAAKLVATSTLFGALAVLGEALALADGLGLSHEAAWSVLAATPLAAQAERRRSSVESGDYPPRFALSLARKDADLILEAAAGAAVDLRLLAAARAWLADAERAGCGTSDYSAVLAEILSSRERSRRKAEL